MTEDTKNFNIVMGDLITKYISDIIYDASVISNLIRNYFKENNNIYIGNFLHKNRESRELSAFYTGEYVIVEKYTFVNENIYYDVDIRFFVDEHNKLIIRDGVIFIIDIMTVTIHGKIDELDPEYVLNTSFKRCNSNEPMVITPNMKLFDSDKRFGFFVRAKLMFNYTIEFNKEVDN